MISGRDIHLLFITDPWETLDHPRDTTLRLIEEAVKGCLPCWWADVRGIRWSPQGAEVRAGRVTRVDKGRSSRGFRLADTEIRPIDQFTMVLYRTDPPVDLFYLQPLQLLAAPAELRGLADGVRKPEFVNPLALLAVCSEKLGAAFCRGLMPSSLAASEWDVLRLFGMQEGSTVVKPLHTAQSKGVDLLHWKDGDDLSRNESVLRRATEGFRRPVLLQRFLPAVCRGETRLWFLDGSLLAVVAKLPADGSYRIDMDKGGRLVGHDLTPREREIAPVLGGRLAQMGARLAAIDVIDGFVTDFNITSPALIPGMEEVLGRNLARPILESLLAGRPSDPKVGQ